MSHTINQASILRIISIECFQLNLMCIVGDQAPVCDPIENTQQHTYIFIPGTIYTFIERNRQERLHKIVIHIKQAHTIKYMLTSPVLCGNSPWPTIIVLVKSILKNR